MQFIRRLFARRPAPREGFPCPHCGGQVPAGRRACPECGASDSDGWSDNERTEPDGWDDDDFDYEEYVRREFASREPEENPQADPKRLILWLVIAAFAAAMVLPLFW